VKVESYGTLMSLNQVASIGIEDARTLRISPWDSGLIATIETAMREAELGLSVVVDSAGLRAVFPELTAERRDQLLKLAKSKLEDARIAVRAARDEAMKLLDRQEKDGDISEDEKFTKKTSVQKAVDDANQALEALFEKKSTELTQ
jgi:ribosome recycling factor